MCSRIEGLNPDIGNYDDASELSPGDHKSDTFGTGNRTCALEALEVASLNSNDCLLRTTDASINQQQ